MGCPDIGGVLVDYESTTVCIPVYVQTDWSHVYDVQSLSLCSVTVGVLCATVQLSVNRILIGSRQANARHIQIFI